MIYILVALLFWCGIGISIIRDELRQNSSKLIHLTRNQFAVVFAKSFFYGPFTGKYVLPK
ncbi:MAG: hypothetical protein NTZ13_01955 [Candidatus Parcubacteria bacterium]|nr:hypothetical protein [Candidatus Parcubacteria bacterium]